MKKMRKIRKIFNNNIISAVGSDGVDVILVGAGLGYLTHRGGIVDERRVEREFHLIGASRGGAFRVLLELPLPVIRMMNDISAHLRGERAVELSQAAELALADHISTALARLADGIPIYNSMLWETKLAYPNEFLAALEVADIVHKQTGTRLPLDEVGFITLHLVAGGIGPAGPPKSSLRTILEHIVEVVQDELHVVIDESDAAGARLMTHLKFLIQRITRTQTYSGPVDEFFRSIRDENPAAFHCASTIGDLLEAEYGITINDEERSYIMLHLVRLTHEIAEHAAADSPQKDETS
ncbi:PRD domain-containing protein [Micropruina sp.]|uniref:BglG family transcription antiterminator n=1 Tax=Micropruina sp. TaxID=2737536 RepID=UPI00262DA7D4|nr:PRD domain-containing protein [Micropruina sp.]